MPIYEFACNACRARTSIFVRSFSAEVNARCERCGSGDLRRLISRVAVMRSDDFSGLDDGALMSGFDENDPKAMASWARKMQREMGEDAGPEFDEMVDRLERGESLDGGGGDFGGDDLGGLDDF